jgi:hypothetical protein
VKIEFYTDTLHLNTNNIVVFSNAKQARDKFKGLKNDAVGKKRKITKKKGLAGLVFRLIPFHILFQI